MNTFFNENGQLVVVSSDGKIKWRGNPKEIPITKVIALDQGQSAVVLFDYYKWEEGKYLNVAVINETGYLVWQAYDSEGRLSGDPFSDIRLDGQELHGTTWGGKQCIINLSSGSISYRNFTK